MSTSILPTRLLALVSTSVFLLITSITTQAQEVLAEEKGVSLSYNERYVNSIECSGTKYEQYEVMAYVTNESGHTIDIENSWISHHGYVTSCGNMIETAYLNRRTGWADGSTMSYKYYVAILPGETLSIDTWRLGAFRFVD